MKKSTKLIVALLVVVAALAVTYRLMHRVPSADLEANAQMQQIITDAGPPVRLYQRDTQRADRGRCG